MIVWRVLPINSSPLGHLCTFAPLHKWSIPFIVHDWFIDYIHCSIALSDFSSSLYGFGKVYSRGAPKKWTFWEWHRLVSGREHQWSLVWDLLEKSLRDVKRKLESKDTDVCSRNYVCKQLWLYKNSHQSKADPGYYCNITYSPAQIKQKILHCNNTLKRIKQRKKNGKM